MFILVKHLTIHTPKCFAIICRNVHEVRTLLCKKKCLSEIRLKSALEFCAPFVRQNWVCSRKSRQQIVKRNMNWRSYIQFIVYLHHKSNYSWPACNQGGRSVQVVMFLCPRSGASLHWGSSTANQPVAKNGVGALKNLLQSLKPVCFLDI